MLRLDTSPSVSVTYGPFSSDTTASITATWAALADTIIQSGSGSSSSGDAADSVLVAAGANASSSVAGSTEYTTTSSTSESTSSATAAGGAAHSTAIAEAMRLAGRRKVVRPLPPQPPPPQPQPPSNASHNVSRPSLQDSIRVKSTLPNNTSSEADSVANGEVPAAAKLNDTSSSWSQLRPLLQKLLADMSTSERKNLAAQQLTEADLKEALRLLLEKQSLMLQEQQQQSRTVEKSQREVEINCGWGDVGAKPVKLVVCVPRQQHKKPQRDSSVSRSTVDLSVMTAAGQVRKLPRPSQAKQSKRSTQDLRNRDSIMPVKLVAANGDEIALPGVELCRDSSTSHSPPGAAVVHTKQMSKDQIKPQKPVAPVVAKSRDRNSLAPELIGGLHKKLQLEWDEARSTTSTPGAHKKNWDNDASQTSEQVNKDYYGTTADTSHEAAPGKPEQGEETGEEYAEYQEGDFPIAAAADVEMTAEDPWPQNDSVVFCDEAGRVSQRPSDEFAEEDDDDESDEASGQGRNKKSPELSKKELKAKQKREEEEAELERQRQLEEASAAATAAEVAAEEASINAATRKELWRRLLPARVARLSCPPRLTGHLASHEEQVVMAKRLLAVMNHRQPRRSRVDMERLRRALKLNKKQLKLSQCRRSSSDDTAGQDKRLELR